MIRFIKNAMKKQAVSDVTNKFVQELTEDDINKFSDTEMVSILNETKTRIKKCLEAKNEKLNKELDDNRKALFILMNPNMVEDNQE